MEPYHQTGQMETAQPIICNGLCTKKDLLEKLFSEMYFFMSHVRRRYGGLLLTFVNQTAHDVDLIWLDYDGEEIPIIKMKPREMVRLSTLTSHNWTCRNTNTGRYYLLGTRYTLYGMEFANTPNIQLIQISEPKMPASLKELTATFVNDCIKEPGQFLSLPLPFTLQTYLFNFNVLPSQREYYSKDGENGIYRKSYRGNEFDGGPWICPIRD